MLINDSYTKLLEIQKSADQVDWIPELFGLSLDILFYLGHNKCKNITNEYIDSKEFNQIIKEISNMSGCSEVKCITAMNVAINIANSIDSLADVIAFCTVEDIINVRKRTGKPSYQELEYLLNRTQVKPPISNSPSHKSLLQLKEKFDAVDPNLFILGLGLFFNMGYDQALEMAPEALAFGGLISEMSGGVLPPETCVMMASIAHDIAICSEDAVDVVKFCMINNIYDVFE